MICAKPLSMLAVMNPVWPVVMSWTIVSRPSSVSRTVTIKVSPGFIRKVSPGITACLLGSLFSGSPGACDLPSRVRNANEVVSSPTLFWQSRLLAIGPFGPAALMLKLLMCSATAYCVAV